MIKITTSLNSKAEKNYIFSYIFYELWNIEYKIFWDNSSQVNYLFSFEGNSFSLPDIFLSNLFRANEFNFKTLANITKLQNISYQDLGLIEKSNKQIPLIFYKSNNNKWFSNKNSKITYWGIDAIGTIFFFLSRYEEYICKERDTHDRFPFTKSIACRFQLVDRPLVNEYLEVLWLFLKTICPSLTQKKKTLSIHLTHDVDFPALTSPKPSYKKIASDFLHDSFINKAPRGAILNAKSKLLQHELEHFDSLMDISEKNDIKSSFFFIPGQTNSKYDGNYSIYDPNIKKLLKRISSRGHEIGFHPSYETYLDAKQTKLEFNVLSQICNQLSIKQINWGGRQHYLRFRTPETWKNWEQAGLHFDSTLGFAEHEGFRCGTNFEFPIYDLHSRKQLKLREHPLLFMDTTYFSKEYMNSGIHTTKMIESIKSLLEVCKPYGGTFTLLLHDNYYTNNKGLLLYREIIELLSSYNHSCVN